MQLSDDDRLRRAVIMGIMCNLAVDYADIEARFEIGGPALRRGVGGEGDDLAVRGEGGRVAVAVRLPGFHVFPAAAARAELALSTSRLDDPPPGALLYLSDVPPGDYRLRLTRRPSAHGELIVGIGRATGAAWVSVFMILRCGRGAFRLLADAGQSCARRRSHALGLRSLGYVRVHGCGARGGATRSSS